MEKNAIYFGAKDECEHKLEYTATYNAYSTMIEHRISTILKKHHYTIEEVSHTCILHMLKSHSTY